MRTFLLMCAVAVCCLYTGTAQHPEWRQMNSAITAFAQRPDNPDVIFAGDGAGVIRRSDDRGATWRVVSLESETLINDIAFLDAERGFAATSLSGLILFTTDGGNTWKRKQFIDAEKPMEYNRFSPTARIVVVDNQTAFFDIFHHPISAPSRKETIVTRDGGNTFRIDSIPGEAYHVSGGTMIALGRETAAFGLQKFTVYKSTDKGMTWTIVKVAPDGLGSDFNNHGINLATFLSADEFFITANKQLASDKKIYRTTDGGNTFTPLNNFPSARVEYLHFKNSSEGFLVSGNAGGHTTFRTSDGGATWTPSAQDVEFEALYLGNDSFIAYVNDHTAISTDFGNTWTEQADPINTVRTSSGSPSLHFLQVIDDNIAYASVGKLMSGVYSGRNLMRTTDGGLSWHLVKDASGQEFKGERFHFVSRDTFFFFGTGYNDGGTNGGYMKIRYTTDGGLTSTDVHTGLYQEEVDGFVFINDNDAVTYGKNSSSINYSTDGGMSWTRVIFPHEHSNIQAAVFPAMNAWYVLTNQNNLMRSTDRGATWTTVTAPQCRAAIHFTDAVTGYAHGCRKELYKTTDGGQTWTDLSAGISSDITSRQYTVMAFRNATEVYMADPGANSRSLARSTDGGATFQWDKSSQLGAWIAKIDFADENTGAMMDVHGNVARYIGPVAYTTDTVYISTQAVGVADSSVDHAISLYPNPAHDVLFIETPSARVHSVEITDLTGRTVLRTAMDGEQTQKIATTTLPTGVYIITVGTDRGAFSQRLHISR